MHILISLTIPIMFHMSFSPFSRTLINAFNCYNAPVYCNQDFFSCVTPIFLRKINHLSLHNVSLLDLIASQE